MKESTGVRHPVLMIPMVVYPHTRFVSICNGAYAVTYGLLVYKVITTFPRHQTKIYWNVRYVQPDMLNAFVRYYSPPCCR